MRRPLLTFALPFVLGVFSGQYVLPENRQLSAAVALLLTGFLGALLIRRERARCMVIALGAALGIVWMWCYSSSTLAPMEKLCGTEMEAVLELVEYPQERDYGARCVVRMEGICDRVMYYGDTSLLALSPGDTLSGTVRCYSAARVGEQESTYYTAQGVFLRLYPVGQMQTFRAQRPALRYLPQYMKREFCSAVEELYSEDARGLILALLTGERERLSEQQITDLEESGLMHLTAVSGLHCGFLVALLSLLVCNHRLLSALIGYPLLLVYTVMVGATPSVVRACVMVGFVLAAPLFERESDGPTSLGAAALVILLVNPYAVASVSFQLSFAAVAGLLALSPHIHEALSALYRGRNRRIRKLWSAFSASLSASLGALAFTAPISAYYFKTISVVSPLANILVLPVISVLFACALLLTILGMFLPGAVLLAFLPEMLAKYVLLAAGLCAGIPGHSVSFVGWATVMWLVLVYAMLAICFFSGEGWRGYLVSAVLGLISLHAAQQFPIRLIADDALTVVTVDVGQGAATLLHSGETTALVDCGSHYCLRGSGAAVVDALRLYGWDTIDYLILTHYHEDHAGGVDELLARVRVGELVVARVSDEESALHDAVIDLAVRYGVSVQYVDETTDIAVGNATCVVYPPLTVGETNEEGLTILCSSGEFDLLITGDMSSASERLLLEAYELPDLEVLLVGHHGSKHSTSQELLRQLLPEVGIISVGENSYGHPAIEAMERMAFYGCEVYRTDRQGNIVISVHE